MPDPKEDAKFDEQAFLLDFFHKTVAANATKVYPNFVQLEGDPTGLMNKLLASGGQEILDLRTEQLPLMVPKIRLYKVFQSTGDEKTKVPQMFEREFIFDDRTTIESITQSARKRGSDVGLKSFTWDDMGTTPADTGFSFEATLKLHFQSFEGVFKTRGKGLDKDPLSFADLLAPPRGRVHIVNGRREYNDSMFQIKVVVGWSVPDDPKRVVFRDPSVLRNSQVTFLLTLQTHDIDIGEDGSVNLTIKYIAAIEGRMMSPRADLLYVENLDYLRSIDRLKREIRITQDETQSAVDSDEASGEEKTGFFGGANLDSAVTRREQKEKRLNDKLAATQRDTRLESYSRLLRSLEDPQDRRILHFNITKKQREDYMKINEEQFENLKDDSKKRNSKLQAHRQDRIGKIISEGGFDLSSANENESHNTLSRLNRRIISAGGDEGKIEGILNDAKEKAAKKGNNIKPTTRINFFFLGDLINSAINIIQQEESGGGAPFDNHNQFRFMLGTIDMINPTDSTGALEAVPLSDIPISLNTFNIWFQKNIISKELSKMPFQTFIRRICSELVVASLNPSSYGSIGKATHTRLSMGNFSLGKKAGQNLVGRKLIKDTSVAIRNSAQAKGAKDLQQYMFLYIGGAVGSSLQGDAAKDKTQGIFHLYSGSDKGIMKKLSFTRTDLPFARESRVANAQKAAEGNFLFSDVYKCSITMIGNPVFKPGMLIFVDPASMGLGNAAKEGSYSFRIGIGGYYLVTKVESVIEDGRFETTLTAESTVPIPSLEQIKRSQKIPGNSTSPPIIWNGVTAPEHSTAVLDRAEQAPATEFPGRRPGRF
jgi:hypothetical protein